MRLDYYRIEPLISASSKRDMIRAQRRKLEDFLMKIAAGPQPADRASVADSFEKLHEEMHHCLYNALFALTPEEQRDPILRRYGAEPEACEPTGLPN
jgi:DNA-directed RNA polymerase specialized sigma24 family protein